MEIESLSKPPEGKSKNTFSFWLQLWDGVWAVPLAFLIFMILGMGGQFVFEEGVGFYDPAFWQAAFMAAGELTLFSSVAFFGMYFNFRGLWRYYKGQKNSEGKVINESKNDFIQLQPWQRLIILLFVYCFFITVLVVLYKAHV